MSERASEDGSAEFVLGYVTTPNRDAALEIARTVVSERLAACANILPSMTSVYHWQGQLQTEEECVLLFKTRRSSTVELSKRVVELHSYACPCVVFVPIVEGNPAYFQWLMDETAAR